VGAEPGGPRGAGRHRALGATRGGVAAGSASPHHGGGRPRRSQGRCVKCAEKADRVDLSSGSPSPPRTGGLGHARPKLASWKGDTPALAAPRATAVQRVAPVLPRASCGRRGHAAERRTSLRTLGDREASRVPGQAAIRPGRHRGPRGPAGPHPGGGRRCARELGRVAVKAQVPIGGRGKAGGIAVVSSPDEAHREAARILAMEIRGYPVRSVWCEAGLEIAHELYLGSPRRDRRRLALILSAAGGMEIEEVAATSPERIAKLWPDPFAGPHPSRFASWPSRRSLTRPRWRGARPSRLRPGAACPDALPLALDLDAVTCEINPLASPPTAGWWPPTASWRWTRRRVPPPGAGRRAGSRFGGRGRPHR